jgi:hypothetical protein
MPRTCTDTADAIELAETLQLIARWLTADPERLAASLLDFIGHPAYGPDALHADLDRFTFLLGGNDGEFLLGDDPDLPRQPAETAVKTHEQKSPAQPPSAVRTHEQPRSKLTNEATRPTMSTGTRSQRWCGAAARHGLRSRSSGEAVPMTSSLLIQRLTDDDLWARVARQARCAGSGLDPDQWYPVSVETVPRDPPASGRSP